MQFGMIGLGRMGAGMVRRLMRGGHTCVAYDRSPQAVEALVKDGATGASSLAEFVKKLEKPRAWAALTMPNVNFWPGTGRSWALSQVTCRKTPLLGPPL